MISLLLRFWPYLLGGIIIIGLGLLINSWRIDAAKVPGLEKQIVLLNEQIIAEREQYKKNLELTQTASQEYEDEIIKRDADIKRLSKRPTQCVPVTKPSNIGDATNQPGEQNIATGISSAFLIEFAGECETDRIKVITLQNFITRVWKLNEDK